MNDSKQFDLSQAPEIVQAQLLLNQLERRHGASAFPDCYRLCERFRREVDNRSPVRAGRDAVVQRIPQPNGSGLPDRFTVSPKVPESGELPTTPQVARFTKLIISMALRPELERRIAQITGETQTEFTRAFPLDRHPRCITIPWLRRGLGVLVEDVARYLI